jgi:hypothetical protein
MEGATILEGATVGLREGEDWWDEGSRDGAFVGTGFTAFDPDLSALIATTIMATKTPAKRQNPPRNHLILRFVKTFCHLLCSVDLVAEIVDGDATRSSPATVARLDPMLGAEDTTLRSGSSKLARVLLFAPSDKGGGGASRKPIELVSERSSGMGRKKVELSMLFALFVCLSISLAMIL